MTEPFTVNDMLESYVHSPAFDKDCAMCTRPPSRDGESDYYSSDHSNLLEKDSSSTISPAESSGYDVSKIEAHLYYFGIRGPRFRGPKLIFRTSKDVFTVPQWSDKYPRHKQLLPVHEHEKLGKDDLWATIRSKVVELLDQRNIKFSSIDLVRFSWVEKNEDYKYDENDEDDEDSKDEDDEDEEDDVDIKSIDIKSIDIKVTNPCRRVFTTSVTIWVGVLPDTLTGEVAFHSSNDILNLLKEHGISDIDIAYRESVARGFSDLELFAPVSYSDPLKAVIDPVTTALGLPIAGLNTLRRQGTMGFYFRVGKDLYAVTARHILFPEDEGNYPYSYIAGPKKEVVLMGTRAFTDFLISIQGHIGLKNIHVSILEEKVMALTVRSEGNDPNAKQAAGELVRTRHELSKTRRAIEELKKFFVKMKKQWTKPKDRVIGHVIWAPPISASTTPHSYTKDVCVIKLDEKKFLQNSRGNVLDLGPEINPKFFNLIYTRTDARSHFIFEHLLRLQGILSTKEMHIPDDKDRKDNPIRYVIKHGFTTFITIGSLSSRDSVEAAVYTYYDNKSGPFCRSGDSGSIIADTFGKFVALLTSGTGPTDSPDITYGTPIYWLWEVIKAEFPGANLYFENND